jgi:hypothetical protein
MSSNETNGAQPEPEVIYIDNNWLHNNLIFPTFKVTEDFAIGGSVVKLGHSQQQEVGNTQQLIDAIAAKNARLYSGIFQADESPEVFTHDASPAVRFEVDAPRGTVATGHYNSVLHVWATTDEPQGPGHLPRLHPILVFRSTTPAPPQYITLRGLDEFANILFPLEPHHGFPLPAANRVTPRLVVIKGTAGTGKTTLATQIMLAFARAEVRCTCTYLCTNDREDAIRHTADSFGFCSREEFSAIENAESPRIFIRNIFGTFEEELDKLQRRNKDLPEGSPDSREGSWFADILKAWKLPWHEPGASLPAPAGHCIFIDSLDPCRQSGLSPDVGAGAVRTLLHELKRKEWISFVILEESPSVTDPIVQRHIADCEHMADILIELRADATGEHQLNTFRVAKRHFGYHILGWHEYKLLRKEHSLANIDTARGFTVYPSIHYYLSASRRADTYSRKGDFVHTGIAHLDSILSHDGAFETIGGHTVPSNSCFVVQGHDSPYDSALATNLLLGGLWRPRFTPAQAESTVEINKDVLWVSLAEETNVDLGREALAYRTRLCTARRFGTELDNGRWIRWRRHDATLGTDAFIGLVRHFGLVIKSREIWSRLRNAGILDEYGRVSESVEGHPLDVSHLTALNIMQFNDRAVQFAQALFAQLVAALRGEDHLFTRDGLPNCAGYARLFEKYKNIDKKVTLNKWCVHLSEPNGNAWPKCAKVVIAVFRPGWITPDQFLHTLQQILDCDPFSRVMFTSTALLANRFPLLARSELFLTALLDLFKSRNMMSIFLDPQSGQIKSSLSISLGNQADYLIELRGAAMNLKPAWPKGAGKAVGDLQKLLTSNVEECPYSTLLVRNLRGKNYTRPLHVVAARPIIGPPVNHGAQDIEQALRELAGGKTADLMCILKDWGFIEEKSEMEIQVDSSRRPSGAKRPSNHGDCKKIQVNESIYMRTNDFAALCGAPIATLGLDQAKVWGVLTRFRPSQGNELHCVNLSHKSQVRNTPGRRASDTLARRS